MMYVEIAALIVLSIYPLSFVRYSWSKNKCAALGVMLLVALAAFLSLYKILLNNQ